MQESQLYAVTVRSIAYQPNKHSNERYGMKGRIILALNVQYLGTNPSPVSWEFRTPMDFLDGAFSALRLPTPKYDDLNTAATNNPFLLSFPRL